MVALLILHQPGEPLLTASEVARIANYDLLHNGNRLSVTANWVPPTRLLAWPLPRGIRGRADAEALSI